jgi:hypothetical protein
MVRDAAAEACGDAGCWALAAIESTDKATPVIITRMVFPLLLFFFRRATATAAAHANRSRGIHKTSTRVRVKAAWTFVGEVGAARNRCRSAAKASTSEEKCSDPASPALFRAR